MSVREVASVSDRLRSHDEALASARVRVGRVAKWSSVAVQLAFVGAVTWMQFGSDGGLTAWRLVVAFLCYSVAVRIRDRVGDKWACYEADKIQREHPAPGAFEMARALGIVREPAAVAPEKMAN